MMRKPDEIMAEFLLKGGKMLAKTCPNCHSPLFEYKGETFCVVCREEREENNTASFPEKIAEESLPVASSGSGHMHPAETILSTEYEETIRVLLHQIRTEKDSHTILTLVKALQGMTESYALLIQGYGCRERS